MSTSYYSGEELSKIGFGSIGKNVKISKKTSIYNPSRISIGNDVRVDDYCVLSGHIILGNNVHLAVYCSIFAGETGVILNDFCGVSSRTAIYAESDDYSGLYLTNPTIDNSFRGIICGQVVLGKYVIIGTGSTILPGVTIGEGSAVGSMSLVNKSLDSWGIYVGIPCKYIKERSKHLLELENDFKKHL